MYVAAPLSDPRFQTRALDSILQHANRIQDPLLLSTGCVHCDNDLEHQFNTSEEARIPGPSRVQGVKMVAKRCRKWQE